MARRPAFMPLICLVIASASSGVDLIIDLMSPPAKKVFFAEVMTTPLASPDSTAPCSFSTSSGSSPWKVSFMVLTGWFGSSMVMVTMPSPSWSHLNMLMCDAPCFIY